MNSHMRAVGALDLDALEIDQIYSANSFICTYRKPHLIMSLIMLGLSGLALSFPIQHWVAYKTLSAVLFDDHWDATGSLSPLFIFCGGLFLFTAVWYFLSSRNQTI